MPWRPFGPRIAYWTEIWHRQTDRPADGACTAAPAAVVRDLYRIRCPGFAALHARAASTDEVALLRRALRSKITPYWRDVRRLNHPCVSRLDANWAAAELVFADATGIAWFRRGGSWRVVAETLIGHGALPPPHIVLSLATCVGYDAGEYNG